MFSWLRSLRSDRYIHIGCVALHALRSVRCFRVFGSRRYVPNGCVASVAFVPFTSFRSERNDVNARNVSHRLRWLASVRCKPFIHQPHQPVSVKDCQKKLNFSLTLGVKVFKVADHLPPTHPPTPPLRHPPPPPPPPQGGVRAFFFRSLNLERGQKSGFLGR